MEHQLCLSILAHLVAHDKTPRRTRHDHPDWRILAVYLWAVVHDRPTLWACDRINSPIHRRRHPLPSPATICKRLRTASVAALLDTVFDQFTRPTEAGVFWILDGKPLPISGISGDREGRCGRSAGGMDRGYKLHVILNIHGEIAACEVQPMNVDERVVAARLLTTPHIQGYVSADANFDSNKLHAICDAIGNLRLITPRRYAKTAQGTGHRKQSAGRQECLKRLDHPYPAFTEDLLRARGQIERDFGNMTNWGGGLGPLPSWVRTLDRVNRWVRCKLLFTAARRHAKTTTCVA
ncbi:MAG: transposase [Gemmataceae bacterium]